MADELTRTTKHFGVITEAEYARNKLMRSWELKRWRVTVEGGAVGRWHRVINWKAKSLTVAGIPRFLAYERDDEQ
jgi:hypothetical protein